MTQRNHTTPVRGRARTKDEMWGDDVRDGDYAIHGESKLRILCQCPCGCGSMMNLPIYRDGTPKEARQEHAEQACWSWNGNLEAATLAPSIRDLSGCRFHGYLRDGVWTFCSDSGRGATC